MNDFIVWLGCMMQEQLLEMIWASGDLKSNEDKLELFDSFIACLQLQREILDEQPELIK